MSVITNRQVLILNLASDMMYLIYIMLYFQQLHLYDDVNEISPISLAAISGVVAVTATLNIIRVLTLLVSLLSVKPNWLGRRMALRAILTLIHALITTFAIYNLVSMLKLLSCITVDGELDIIITPKECEDWADRLWNVQVIVCLVVTTIGNLFATIYTIVKLVKICYCCVE
jgi:hypothetical protein